MNFGHTKTNGLAMKRRTIARFQKDHKTLKTIETPRSGHNYITLAISPEVRSRVSSLERTTNSDKPGTVTNMLESMPPLNPLLENSDANSISGVDIQLPTFNGNGAEDPEKHWL